MLLSTSPTQPRLPLLLSTPPLSLSPPLLCAPQDMAVKFAVYETLRAVHMRLHNDERVRGSRRAGIQGGAGATRGMRHARACLYAVLVASRVPTKACRGHTPASASIAHCCAPLVRNTAPAHRRLFYSMKPLLLPPSRTSVTTRLLCYCK